MAEVNVPTSDAPAPAPTDIAPPVAPAAAPAAADSAGAPEATPTVTASVPPPAEEAPVDLGGHLDQPRDESGGSMLEVARETVEPSTPAPVNEEGPSPAPAAAANTTHHEAEPQHPEAEPAAAAFEEANDAAQEAASDEAPVELPDDSTAEPVAVAAGPDGGEASGGEASGEEQGDKHWYVVKVTSGREDSIKEAIERRALKEGLQDHFGKFDGKMAIVIPVEKVTEVKVNNKGKRVTRTRDRKLYPGYLMVQVEYNDRILYLFRETSGVGDFVGAHPNNLERAPTPMSEREVQRMLGPTGEQQPAVVAPPKGMTVGEHVRVVDGTFNGMEGTVKQIQESVAKVQVELTIFGRPVNVDLEYYQVEQA